MLNSSVGKVQSKSRPCLPTAPYLIGYRLFLHLNSANSASSRFYPKTRCVREMRGTSAFLSLHRVSVNDMKMSAQDLSRPAFRFVVYANCFLGPCSERPDSERSDSKRRKQMHYSQQIQSARKHITFPYLYAFVAFVACALFTTGGLLSAQTGGTGAISGAITDPTGAMVVSAQVKITDVATGYIRAAQSNDHGLYVFSLLPRVNTQSKSRNKGSRWPRRRTCRWS